MGKRTGIEWTDHTFNGVLGCEKVSEACKHCYAENESPVRISRQIGLELWGGKAARRAASENMWDDLYRWDRQAKKEGRQRKVFCYSLGDVFEDYQGQLVNHEGKPLFVRFGLGHDEMQFTTDNPGPPVTMTTVRERLWYTIRDCQHLIFQLLTKRPENVNRMVWKEWTNHRWPKNVWLGTTTENQKRFDERIGHLINSGAHTKFISCEPLLSDIQLGSAAGDIDWVICGGESLRTDRHKAAIMQRAWVRSLRDQCHYSDIPFFFKQWGDWAPFADIDFDSINDPDAWLENPMKTITIDPDSYHCIGKKHTGNTIDGKQHLNFPNH